MKLVKKKKLLQKKEIIYFTSKLYFIIYLKTFAKIKDITKFLILITFNN